MSSKRTSAETPTRGNPAKISGTSSPRTPTSHHTPSGTPRQRKPLFDSTPPIERHMVKMAKNRSNMTKDYRSKVRNIFHQTDKFAIFQQDSAIVIPPELTPRRYILGKYLFQDEKKEKDAQSQEEATDEEIDQTAEEKIENFGNNEFNENEEDWIDDSEITASDQQTHPHFDDVSPEENVIDDKSNLNNSKQNIDLENSSGDNIFIGEKKENIENQEFDDAKHLVVVIQEEEEEEAVELHIDFPPHVELPPEDLPQSDDTNEEEIVDDVEEETIEVQNLNEKEGESGNEEENPAEEEETQNQVLEEEETQNENNIDEINEEITEEEEEEQNENENEVVVLIEEVHKEITIVPEVEKATTEVQAVQTDNQNEKTAHFSRCSVAVETDDLIDIPTPKDISSDIAFNSENGNVVKPFMPPQSPLRFAKLDRNDPSISHTGEQLLEISIRPYLYGLSNKYGRPITVLRDIPEMEFNDWQSMGFNWIWLYGVWQIGEYVLKHDLEEPELIRRYSQELPGWTHDDVIGYPLCIYQYEINPQIGTFEDLIWFRQQLKKRGILLMLDFVPNDTAIDSPLLKEHPEFYIRTDISRDSSKYDSNRFMENGIAYGAGKWMPPMHFNAQLNLFRYDVRDYQINNLLHISNYCDGVRVHLAQYLINSHFDEFWDNELGDCRAPPDEFWKVAIDRVRSIHPNFVMMGESYGYENQEKLLECGFNYIYEKELLDKLVFSDVSSFRSLIFQNHYITNKMVHFVENHDEPRVLNRFWKNQKMACAGSAALLTLPGIRLINFHQWLGYMNQIDVNLRRAHEPQVNKDVMLFYTRLFRVLDTNAIRYGTWKPLVVHESDSVLAWKWVKGDQHILVTINFKDDWSGGRVICDDAPLDMREIAVHELIYNTTYIRDPQEMRDTGLVLYLEKYQTQIFEY